jgi:transposase
VPHGHWQTLTFLAALRHDQITAPWLIDGPINGESFRVYVENVLVPTLRPGDIVIMDNLGSHRGHAVRRAIRVEQFFAKLKHWLRKAAQRSSDAVCDAIGHMLKTVSATECSNYFENAGYNQM